VHDGAKGNDIRVGGVTADEDPYDPAVLANDRRTGIYGLRNGLNRDQVFKMLCKSPFAERKMGRRQLDPGSQFTSWRKHIHFLTNVLGSDTGHLIAVHPGMRIYNSRIADVYQGRIDVIGHAAFTCDTDHAPTPGPYFSATIT